MNRKLVVGAAAVLLVAVAFSALGCSFGEIYWNDPFKRQVALQKAQKRYTDLFRFSHFQGAAMYVDPALREEFLEKVPSVKDVRFTDYEAESIDLDEPEAREVAVHVTYSAYNNYTMIEVSVEETQNWYREGITNNWMVRPEFSGLEQLKVSRSD